MTIKNNVTSSKIRDFIPCYSKQTGGVGLYDLVTRRYFGNANAGGVSFIAGPDVNQ